MAPSKAGAVGDLKNYRLLKLLDSVHSKKIFLAINLRDGRHVAIKVEEKKRQKANSNLQNEFNNYRKLATASGMVQAICFGVNGKNEWLVMELLGPSLLQLFRVCDRRFSLKTVIMLADQMISVVEQVHNAGFLHGDINPESFVMGVDRNCNKVYIVNAKHSTKYMVRRTHVGYQENQVCEVSPHFVSINRLLQTRASRRDDVESVIYVLIYFLRGGLPWQAFDSADFDDAHERIVDLKTSLSSEALCNGLPHEFAILLDYCRALSYTEAPDYLYLRKLLRMLMISLNYENDYLYDWVLMDRSTTSRQK